MNRIFRSSLLLGIVLAVLAVAGIASAQSVSLGARTYRYDDTYDTRSETYWEASLPPGPGGTTRSENMSIYTTHTSTSSFVQDAASVGSIVFYEDWRSGSIGEINRYDVSGYGTDHKVITTEDVDLYNNNFQGEDPEQRDDDTTTTRSRTPALPDTENPITTVCNNNTRNNPRSVFARDINGATIFACRWDYVEYNRTEITPERRIYALATRRGSEYSEPKLLIDAGEIPAGQVAYLDYSITWYEYQFFPTTVNLPALGGGRRDYHLRLSSLGGTAAVINGAAMTLANNSCRVFSVSGATITFENSPGSPPFIGIGGVPIAFAAGARYSKDESAGTVVRTDGTLTPRRVPTRTAEQIVALREAIERAAYNNFLNNLLPAIQNRETLFRNWFIDLALSIRNAFGRGGTQALLQPFGKRAACAGFNDLHACIVQMLDRVNSPLLHPVVVSGSPTPTPSPPPPSPIFLEIQRQ